MKAAAYNSLPIIGEGHKPTIGDVLWVCPRTLTPDAKGQKPTEETFAQKYVSLGTVATKGSCELKAALCFDTLVYHGKPGIFSPGTDDDMPTVRAVELAAISLGSPETLDPKIEEIRFDGGRWSVDSIRGAMYAWAPDATKIDAALSEILGAQATSA